jgi:hypothetical protein
MLHGGYDGVNFLDSSAKKLNDKSTSFDTSGAAEANYVAPGLVINPNGTGQTNSSVLSYTTAVDIMTDPMVVNINILGIPGIRETYITDYTLTKVRDYGLAYYIMDIPSYDDGGTRLYDESTTRPDVEKTVSSFDSRAIDNNYAGTYFPSVTIDDTVNEICAMSGTAETLPSPVTVITFEAGVVIASKFITAFTAFAAINTVAMMRKRAASLPTHGFSRTPFRI